MSENKSDLKIKSSSDRGLLTLIKLRGVGPQTLFKIVDAFEKLEDIRSANKNLLDKIFTTNGIESINSENSWEKAFDEADIILEKANKLKIKILTYKDERYPALLKNIPDRPPILFLKGEIKPKAKYVACIGTREPSKFGIDVTNRIVSVLAENGFSIVSGLALGIDSIAHQTAIDKKVPTIAILGNGLDSIYPKKNKDLADKIIDEGGAILSEQVFGSPPIPRNLVQRDRIQSGMSLGTIVMQTDVKGGSMHTVKFTLMQGRLLFAPKPFGKYLEDTKCRGTLAIIKKSGTELSKLLNADGEYEKLLKMKYENKPIAIQLEGKKDYESMINILKSEYSSCLENNIDKKIPQMELFQNKNMG